MPNLVPASAVARAISDHYVSDPLNRPVDRELIDQLKIAQRQLELLQAWKDAKLLADLHVGDGNTSDEQQTEYKSRELAALKALSNS